MGLLFFDRVYLYTLYKLHLEKLENQSFWKIEKNIMANLNTYDLEYRNFYIDLIQKYIGNIDQLPNSSEWRKIVLKAKVEILEEFAASIQQFYTVSQLRFLKAIRLEVLSVIFINISI